MTRVVVVTGASAGIGRATAIAFARRGARVALLARGEDGLRGALRDVERAGGEGLVVTTDVADAAQVEAAAERVEREWGAVDVWVNNAMATVFCPLEEIAVEDFRRATKVTYLGAVWGTRAALRRMKARNRGVIVQVGSALSYRSIPLQSPYCGAKSALRGFTDSVRSELLHAGSAVRVTTVLLAAFNTPQFDWARTCAETKPRPMGTVFQPEVAANAIVWAAAHAPRHLYVGWPALKALLGNMVLPRLLDRLLARRGYRGQFSGERISPGRADNLHAPVAGDRGARGRFGGEARATSWTLELAKKRIGIALALAGAAGGLLFLMQRRD